jgi:spermidine synthase
LPRLRWYFCFFLISGFCSLVYEVVWIRLAMAEFGVTTAMVSIVLSMFMAGLGLGSWGAGILARRLLEGAASSCLRLYALAEILVGTSALLVPHQLRWGHELLLRTGNALSWQSLSYYVASGLWVAVTLVPWCAFMGATFPLLMAVIRQTCSDEGEHSFSYLYVANVLGALLGTIASAFFLIELLGFQGTLRITSLLNGLVACSALALAALPLGSRSRAIPAVEPEAPERLYGLPPISALWILLATGLASMGMEMIWIRQFAPYLGNIVYAFASILGLYLLATFWGSRHYRSWVYSHTCQESAPA